MKTLISLWVVFFAASCVQADSIYTYSVKDGYSTNRSRVQIRTNPGVPSGGGIPYTNRYNYGGYYYPEYNGTYYYDGNTSMSMGTLRMLPSRPYRPYYPR